MWGNRKKKPGRIGEPRASGSGYTDTQLDLAIFIEGEYVRIWNLPALEPFRVLGLEPTVNMGDIREQAGIRLAMLDDDTVREIGLHRHPGNWLLKARWLRERLQEAWRRLEQLHQNYELQDYARARGAPDRTARTRTPPPLPRETRPTTPTTGTGKPPNLPN